MAEQIDPKELVSFKEMLMANAIQFDAEVRLLIEKGFFTEAEYFARLKKVQRVVCEGSQNPLMNVCSPKRMKQTA